VAATRDRAATMDPLALRRSSRSAALPSDVMRSPGSRSSRRPEAPYTWGADVFRSAWTPMPPPGVGAGDEDGDALEPRGRGRSGLEDAARTHGIQIWLDLTAATRRKTPRLLLPGEVGCFWAQLRRPTPGFPGGRADFCRPLLRDVLGVGAATVTRRARRHLSPLGRGTQRDGDGGMRVLAGSCPDPQGSPGPPLRVV